jgi:hypothetical protein
MLTITDNTSHVTITDGNGIVNNFAKNEFEVKQDVTDINHFIISEGDRIDFDFFWADVTSPASANPEALMVILAGYFYDASATGQTTMAGSMSVVIASDQSEVPINLPASNLSAFGTLETNELTPIIQGDFVYGLNTQIWDAPITNAGASTIPTAAAMSTPEAGSRLKLSSGVTSGAYAYVTSRKIIRYRAGQGVLARFTPLFTSGVANNIQLWGVGTIVSNAPYDGYFFGYNGTTFSIFHYVRGIAQSGYPVAQSSWNGDKVDGTTGTSFNWDKTKGVPCMIKYPYLGYGDVEFFVQNPTTGRFVLVHTIQYANQYSTTQLGNPSMQFVGFTSNSAGTSGSVDMYCGSVGVMLSGQRSFVGNPKWAADSSGMASVGTGVKTIGTTETCLFSLRNCTTYNGITNRGVLRLNSISVGTSTNNSNMIIRLLIGSTFTTTPVFTPISGTTANNGVTITSGNSIASVDVAGTTITSIANRGTYLYNISLCGNSAQIIDLTSFDIFINPSEVLTISGQASINSSTTASLNWTEDI